MTRSSIFILSLSLLGLTLATALAKTNYIVENRAATTPDGARFDDEIGEDYAKTAMASAADFILNEVYGQSSENERRSVHTVKLIVVDDETDMSAVRVDKNEILIRSEDFINSVGSDMIKKDFDGEIYRQMARIWLWDGRGRAPEGLVTGMADFVLLKAGFAPSDWVAPGGGDRWDQGFDITARFLDYCNDLWEGFVAELNKMMKSGYSDDLFVQLTGKTVDQLWSDYKAMYAN